MNFDQTVVWKKLTDQGGTFYTETTDQERESMRTWVKSLLLEQQITIEFEKADGTIRAMNCTLNEAHGAKYSTKDDTSVNQQSDSRSEKILENKDPHVQRVWDCDIGAWRSFRYDRLKRINFTIGKP